MSDSKTNILVVDDEKDLESLIRQKFRKKIREGSYDFLFAANGKEALDVLAEHSEVDLVLSDINMPEMDGLTLLVRIAEDNPLVKVVMVSAYGDMENIRVAMNRGAFDFVCKPVDFEDLGITIEKTINHIREIKKTINAIKENDILRMYVDDSVLHFMNRQEFEHSLRANETIQASVLFVDICGFTAISENESADFVVKFLNDYFDMIVKEIIAHDGIVDKFIGDCVMAVFRGEYHLDRAVDAALAIRNKIENIKEPVVGKKVYNPKVSIGVNTGEMISGNIGASSLKRLDFTVIGDAVNTAQRLQSAAGLNQIFINEASYHQIKHAFKCREAGQFVLKNKSNPVTCYEVLE